jgi:hypothetical protein
MLGCQLLLPKGILPNGLSSIGIGLILLGQNATRYFNKICLSGFTTFFGFLALIGGIGEMFLKMDLDGALLLIIAGAYLILKPWYERQGLLGKAEQI